MIKLDRHKTAARLAAAIPSPGLRRLLLASLAVNFLVVGFVAGDMIADMVDRRPHTVEMSLGPIARALGENDRKAILADLRDNPVIAGFHHGAADIDIAGLVRVLRAPSFDASAFRTIMAAQAAKVADAQKALQESVITRLASMTSAERSKLADRLSDND